MVKLGIVLCAYNMSRELPRTVYTLSRRYQTGVADLDYEIIVLDNGSREPVSAVELQQIEPNLRVEYVTDPHKSPAAAINKLVRGMDHDIIGLWIDGARMASPGVISHAIDAHKIDSSKIVGTISFHLGPDVQMRSGRTGYNQAVEDELLATVPWRENGNTLFDISVLAGSSAKGWFGRIFESNAVFLAKSVWERLGGLDQRFQEAGGGFANLDFWKRAVSISGNAPWIILGEGTFHQIHGGAATSGSDADRIRMAEEYRRIHAGDFELDNYNPCFVGNMDSARLRAGMPSVDHHRYVHSVLGRNFAVNVPADLIESIQNGTLRTDYKGIRFCKNPFDIALYMRLLQRLRPRTIIEIGVSDGGSSLWFHDQCGVLNLSDTQIIGIDINQPKIALEGFRFFLGNSERPDDTFPSKIFENAPHPWLVIEDSAHTYQSARATLNYFAPRMEKGDYIVVEDGVVADLPGDVYRKYEDGPNRAVSEFLLSHADKLQIDADLCDFYGHNVTYCPNAWLRRL